MEEEEGEKREKIVLFMRGRGEEEGEELSWEGMLDYERKRGKKGEMAKEV